MTFCALTALIDGQHVDSAIGRPGPGMSFFQAPNAPLFPDPMQIQVGMLGYLGWDLG